MNRRRFLAGLGAAVAAVAVATRLGESKLALAAGDGVPLNSAVHPYNYFTDPDSWFIKTEHEDGMKMLSEESLEEMCIEIHRAVDETGVPIRITPTHAIFPARRLS